MKLLDILVKDMHFSGANSQLCGDKVELASVKKLQKFVIKKEIIFVCTTEVRLCHVS